MFARIRCRLGLASPLGGKRARTHAQAVTGDLTWGALALGSPQSLRPRCKAFSKGASPRPNAMPAASSQKDGLALSPLGAVRILQAC